MAIEVRAIRSDEEFTQHHFISHYAFDGDRSEASNARRAAYYDREWCLGAFDGGQLVAGLVIIPFEQYINGAKIPLGGIASVSCLPERRREGHVNALLRSALERMRDAGQPLSALWTPHYSLYRRHGWEIAHRMISYSFPPKPMRLRRPAPKGGFRRVGPGEWPLLQGVYEQHHASRNGGFARTEQRWRNHIFSDYGKGERDAAVWSNAAGEPSAYVVYHSMNRWTTGAAFRDTILRVDDWAALDADAYSAVLGYLLSHDLATSIVLLTGEQEPIADAFEEPAYITAPPGAWFGPMLRLVDVKRAIETRPALPQASGKAVTIALTDASAPGNAGTWHIECREGRVTAERTNVAAQVEMDVCALAPIYNGFTKPIDAARVGSVRVHDEQALGALDDIFATSFAPYCPDDF